MKRRSRLSSIPVPVILDWSPVAKELLRSSSIYATRAYSQSCCSASSVLPDCSSVPSHPLKLVFSIMGEILQLRRSNKTVDGAHAPIPAADVGSDTAVVDPVCGMTVQAAGARYTSAYDGKTFKFCGIGCKERFDHEPERYSVPSPSGRGF